MAGQGIDGSRAKGTRCLGTFKVSGVHLVERMDWPPIWDGEPRAEAEAEDCRSRARSFGRVGKEGCRGRRWGAGWLRAGSGGQWSAFQNDATWRSPAEEGGRPASPLRAAL